MPVPEVIRSLALAADPPRGQDPPRGRKVGDDHVRRGEPLLRVEAVDRKGVKLTLLPHAGGTRPEAATALKALLDKHWV